MTTELTAIVKQGQLQMDDSINLPDDTVVRVTIEEMNEAHRERRKAFEAFKRLIQEQPIDSGGAHFSRDELYERR